VFGTGRLFVDEITGYSWEAVTATNVHTDLMVVDYFTVENAVKATGGPNSHFVHVHAPITFNVGSIDVTSKTVDISSYGQNVALNGANITLSAAGDFIVNSVDFSMVSSGDINGVVGGTFGTYGTVANIQSIGNMTFGATTDIQLTSQDRILLNADVISFDTQNFVLQSEESNIFLSSTVSTTFASLTGNVNFQAGSGLQFGSSHGPVNITGDNMFAEAETFVLSGRSYSEFFLDGNLDFETQSIAGDIWFYTERIFFDAYNLDVDTVLTTDSTTAFESAGNFQMRSFGFSASADDIVVLSVRAIRETAGNDIFYVSEDSTSILAGGKFFYGGQDVVFTSLDEHVSLLVNGIAFVNSMNNDVVMDSPVVLQYLGNNIELYASNLFEIQTRYQILRADTVDFYSFTSMFFNAVNAFFDADQAGFVSHELTQWQVGGDVLYNTQLGDIDLSSTGDIDMINSANVFQSANSITYEVVSDAYVQMQTTTITAGEDIKIETFGELYVSASGDISFVATDDIKVESDNFHMLSGNLNIATADDIVFRAKNSGGFDITANTDFIWTANDEINFSAQGNVQVTSQFGQTITNDDQFNIFTRNLALSFQTGSFQADSVFFTAPEIFSFLPGDISATGEIQLLGGTISAGTSDGVFQLDTADMTDSPTGSETLQSGDLLQVIADTYTHLTASQDITVESDFDKDLTWVGINSMDLSTSAGDFTIDSANVVLQAANGYTATAPTQNYDASKKFSVEATSTVEFDSGSMTVTGFGETIFGAENAVVISLTPGNALTLTANKLLDILMPYGGIDTVVTTHAAMSAADIKLYASLWNSVQQDLSVITTDMEFYFDTIELNFHSMSLDAVNVYLTAERVLDFTVSDAIDVLTDTVTFKGGDVFFQGGDSISLTTTTTGDITVGSLASTTANPNYDIFSIKAGGDFSGTANTYSLILTGREEFQHVGLWLEAGGSLTFGTTVGDFRALTDNGVYITGTNNIDSTSVLNHDFIADNQIAVYAQGNNVNSIDIEATLSTEWRAEISGMTFRASSTVSFLAGDIDLVSKLDISLQSLEDSLTTSDISFLSTGPGDITFTGNDMSIHAGRNEEYTSDILVTVNSDTGLCSTALYDVGKDILIRALGDQVANQGLPQVAFNGGSAAATGATYVVKATNQIEMFPSGAGKVTTLTQGELFMNAAGELTLGSGANRLELRSLGGQLLFNANRDYVVQAGGVNGAVMTSVTNDVTLEATTGNYESYADGTIDVASEGVLSVTAGTDMWFNSTNPWGGIDLLGDNLQVDTQGGAANADLTFKGQNVMVSADAVAIDAAAINFGQKNVYAPQLVAHVSNWDVEAAGDVDLTTSNDDYIHTTSGAIAVTAIGGATLTSGGSASFFATDPDDGSLTAHAVSSLTGTAALFVETELGSGSSLLRADGGLMFLKSSGSKTGNGFLTHTRNDIQFDSVDLIQTISGAAKYTTGTGKYAITTDLLSTSATATFDSDDALSFTSVTKTSVQTTVANSRIEVTTEGVNGDIEFGVASLTVASSNNFFIVADKVVERGLSTTYAARGTNTGKILFDASDLISWVSQKGDISATTSDDMFFQATGENSRLALSSSNLLMNTNRDITFDTQPAEDGSIFFTWGTTSTTPATVSFRADDWIVDIDGDVTVTSPGAFQFTSGGAFETSAGGYSEVISEKSIIMSSTAVGNIGDLHYITENAAVKITSGQTSQISAGSFGLQGSLTSNTDTLDVTVRGNGTATTSDRLSFTTNVGDTSFSAPSGTLSMTASTQVSLAATGITNGNGYLDFVAGTDLTLTSTHAGGDIHFDTIGCHFGAPHLNFLATGTDPEKGYIKISMI